MHKHTYRCVYTYITWYCVDRYGYFFFYLSRSALVTAEHMAESRAWEVDAEVGNCWKETLCSVGSEPCLEGKAPSLGSYPDIPQRLGAVSSVGF